MGDEACGDGTNKQVMEPNMEPNMEPTNKLWFPHYIFVDCPTPTTKKPPYGGIKGIAYVWLRQ